MYFDTLELAINKLAPYQSTCSSFLMDIVIVLRLAAILGLRYKQIWNRKNSHTEHIVNNMSLCTV